MIVTKYANSYLVIHSDIYTTAYIFFVGGWAQRSQAKTRNHRLRVFYLF